jgi:hypothetical protein
VKYVYYYQTSGNENRRGEISARDRAHAYAELRKRGIRPYRLAGDDPVNWRPWALGGIIAVLAVSLTVALWSVRAASDDRAPAARHQLYGDMSVIAEGVFSDWSKVLSRPLDRYLAAYAQPGAFVPPPLLSSSEYSALESDLACPVEYVDGERMEVRQLKNILAGMRVEMKRFLEAGKTVGEYMEFLETRQREEQKFRDMARAHVERSPKSHLFQTWTSVNAALRERALAPIEMPESLRTTEGGMR